MNTIEKSSLLRRSTATASAPVSLEGFAMLIRQFMTFSAAAACGFASGPALSSDVATRPLNDTGMTRCVSFAAQYGPLDQVSVRCKHTGQDGEFGRDVTSPAAHDGDAGFSFTRVCGSGEVAGTGACPRSPILGSGPNNWACTRDEVTHLLWEIKTADGSFRDVTQPFTNLQPGDVGYGRDNDATGYIARINAIGLCGTQRWRMPTALEMNSIVDFGIAWRDVPAIDSGFFPNSQANWWTETSTAAEPDEAYYQQGSGGSLPVGRDAMASVRPVAAARSAASDDASIVTSDPSARRFQTLLEGQEILDRRTGLIWRRCAEGQAWTGLTCAGAELRLDFYAALDHAKRESQRARQPWRMPNVKELASLLNFGQVGPPYITALIDPIAFPATPADFFWTSTPLQIQTFQIGVSPPNFASTNGWYVHFGYGYIFQGYLWLPQRLRLVRDAL